MDNDTQSGAALARHTDREYGVRARIGVAVPQANPTVEPEFWTLVPDGVSVLSTRLRGSSADSRARLVDYLTNFQASLDAYETAALDAVGFACTGTSYLIGAREEEVRVKQFEQSYGAPIITAAMAIKRAMQAIGARRVTLFAPYPDWLISACKDYWMNSGFEITSFGTVTKDTSDTRNVYSVTVEDVLASIRGMDLKTCDVILLTGTGVPTLRALQRLSTETGKPALSSNLCLVWALCKAAGMKPAPASLAAGEPLFGGWSERMSRWA